MPFPVALHGQQGDIAIGVSAARKAEAFLIFPQRQLDGELSKRHPSQIQIESRTFGYGIPIRVSTSPPAQGTQSGMSVDLNTKMEHRTLSFTIKKQRERAEGRTASERTTGELETRKKATISIPYIQGTSEAIRRVLGQLGIRTAMRSSKIKWSIMKGVKDKQKEEEIPGVVYAIGCGDCRKVYVGETRRTAAQRVKEHKSDTRLGVISEFHTSRTNERTFISGGGGLDPIRCAIDSKKISLSQILNSFSLSSSPSFLHLLKKKN